MQTRSRMMKRLGLLAVCATVLWAIGVACRSSESNRASEPTCPCRAPRASVSAGTHDGQRVVTIAAAPVSEPATEPLAPEPAAAASQHGRTIEAEAPAGDAPPAGAAAEEASPAETPVTVASAETGSASSVLPSPAPAPSTEIIVYYFHRTLRCPTCLQLEEWAEQALNGRFPDEVAAGLVQWRPSNIDKEENKHFVDEYKLEGQSLVLVRPSGSAAGWKNLDKIWEFAGDPGKFIPYVEDEVAGYLDSSQ